MAKAGFVLSMIWAMLGFAGVVYCLLIADQMNNLADITNVAAAYNGHGVASGPGFAFYIAFLISLTALISGLFASRVFYGLGRRDEMGNRSSSKPSSTEFVLTDPRK